jgi:hypothetical protein
MNGASCAKTDAACIARKDTASIAGINDKANFEIAIVSLLLQTSFAMLFKVLEKRELAKISLAK